MKTFSDWFWQTLMLVIFCGIVTGIDYLTAHKDTIQVIWWVAAGWVCGAFVRYVYYKISSWDNL